MMRVEFGNKLRDARISAGFSQERLAELMGISPTHIKHMENGRRAPSFDLLYQLCQLLQISVDSVFFPEKDHPSDTEFRAVQLIRQSPESQQRAVVAMLEALNEPTDNA